MPPSNQSKHDPEVIKLDHGNIKGILVSLRYLSREAEGAGLMELARMLEEAELKCDRYIENEQKGERA